MIKFILPVTRDTALPLTLRLCRNDDGMNTKSNSTQSRHYTSWRLKLTWCRDDWNLTPWSVIHGLIEYASMLLWRSRPNVGGFPQPLLGSPFGNNTRAFLRINRQASLAFNYLHVFWLDKTSVVPLRSLTRHLLRHNSKYKHLLYPQIVLFDRKNQ